MNLDLQWLQMHIGTLTTECAALRGSLNVATQQIDALNLEVANLKDQLKQGDDRKAGPQLVAGD